MAATNIARRAVSRAVIVAASVAVSWAASAIARQQVGQ